MTIYTHEPIQWHLATSRHDRCPDCNHSPLYNLGRRKRFCPSCDELFLGPADLKSWREIAEEKTKQDTIAAISEAYS